MHPSRLDDLGLNDEELQLQERLFALRAVRPSFTSESIRAQAAIRRQQRQLLWWRGVCAALAASLAVAIWPHRASRIVPVKGESAVQVVRPIPSESARHDPSFVASNNFALSQHGEGDEYLAVRQRVIGRGMNGLIAPEALMAHAASKPTAASRTEEPLPQVERVIRQQQSSGPIPLLLRMMEREEEL